MSRLNVKVVPGSRRTQVAGLYGDGVKVQVSALPEAERANVAVCEALAESMGIATRQVRIVRGHTAVRKVVEIFDLSDAQLAEWLARFS